MERVAATPRSKLKLALSLFALLAAAAVAYAEWLALPGFRSLFDSFGDIPWLSRWVVEHPKEVWISLRGALIHNFTAICAWLWIRDPSVSVMLGLATAFTWACLAVVLVAFYLPLLTIAV
ncbi:MULTISPECIES: hypothetical protein [unclassified Pseudomonas]|uniref:hypothetical protein n=1 Tax=unclassified Pseudomonas TaxID=196821 RepID=UPI00244998AF|nr:MULTISPECIES: hypothetical protein [unclassified Pseudomonas]MDG9925256.1 hypothetical protein [Pseudomonas sp. GD04045]MDH0036089.1 hypothetical protein [Pseudomonas sp. GD04019]